MKEILAQVPFYVFGMGNRQKYIFLENKLSEYKTGDIIFDFKDSDVEICPSEFKVFSDNDEIYENEEGIFIKSKENTKKIEGGKIVIPDFSEYKYEYAVKMAFHDVMVNIVDTKPVPCFFVYDKPWYRDGAMMCMVLEKTGNISLVKPWIDSITELFDNNNGNEEPDNLGELLCILSCSEKDRGDMIEKIISKAKEITVDGEMQGITDGSHHPVYSQMWLEYGLSRFGKKIDFLKSDKKDDSYELLFWMNNKRERKINNENFNKYDDYPYLNVAKQHYFKEKLDYYLPQKDDFICSWEVNAGFGKYENYNKIMPHYAKNRLSSPHSWHASELFLYLTEEN